jgi:hypothetical protein
MMVKSLAEDLKYWRAERPDEWTMDEFIRKSTKLESTNKQLLEALELAREEIKILLLDAGVVFPDQQETICRIDAAIAAAKGE